MGFLNFSLRRREPLFGLDIGHTSMKVMQLGPVGGKDKKLQVKGYGASYRYHASSIANGAIVDYKSLSDALHNLFDERLIGTISSRKVVCTIPMSNSFSRPLKLPAMAEANLQEAINLEAEQYIPESPNNLYIDYDIVRQDDKNIDLLLVATPKKIIESYMKFLDSMGLEPVALEPTMNATARIFGYADPGSKLPTVLVDFGANAADIAVFDKTLFVNNTVQGGSSTMIDAIAKKLGISHEEAYNVKNERGIEASDSPNDIAEAVKPILDNLIQEIRKIARYFDERVADHDGHIAQTIIIGGGANMPGLSEYLSKELDMPVRMLNPWGKIDFGGFTPPDALERSMFITVAGCAVLDTAEVFNDHD